MIVPADGVDNTNEPFESWYVTTLPSLLELLVGKSAIFCNKSSCAWTLVPTTRPKSVLTPAALLPSTVLASVNLAYS